MIRFYKTSTGLYLGGRFIYISQIRRSLFGFKVTQLQKVSIDLEGRTTLKEFERVQQDAKLAGVISKAFKESGLKPSGFVAVGLPIQETIIRYFEMPAISRKDLREAISFEVKKHVPFKLEDLNWNFQVTVKKKDKKKLGITFLAAKKDTIKRYTDILKRAGLSSFILEPASISLIRALYVSKNVSAEDTVSIIDIDYGSANINIVKNRMIYLTRDISLPIERNSIADSLINEAQITFEYFNKAQPAEEIKMLLLSGESDLLADKASKLSGELNLDLKAVDFAKFFKLKEKLPSGFFPAIGLGLGSLVSGEVAIDLSKVKAVVPQKIKARPFVIKKPVILLKLEEEAVKPLFTSILAATLIIVGFYILPLKELRQKTHEFQELKSQTQVEPSEFKHLSLAALQEKKEQMSKELTAIKALLSQRIYGTLLLDELSRVIPSEIWLSSMKIIYQPDKERKDLILEGVALSEDPTREVDIVSGFLNTLKSDEKFGAFRNIRLDSINRAEINKVLVMKFKILSEAKKGRYRGF